MKRTTASVGEVLKDRRIELEMTQSDVSRKTGLHRGTIANIETGKSGVSFDSLFRLVKALS